MKISVMAFLQKKILRLLLLFSHRQLINVMKDIYVTFYLLQLRILLFFPFQPQLMREYIKQIVS